ncbi:hypothetical protein [Solimonas soli]|uniref:hypothetical protein n=1 Tax=Solimonas soli TaxID=413479 RepID=UPI0012FBF839|nr:hypothetical protein [Solimonas soli]
MRSVRAFAALLLFGLALPAAPTAAGSWRRSRRHPHRVTRGAGLEPPRDAWHGAHRGAEDALAGEQPRHLQPARDQGRPGSELRWSSTAVCKKPSDDTARGDGAMAPMTLGEDGRDMPRRHGRRKRGMERKETTRMRRRTGAAATTGKNRNATRRCRDGAGRHDRRPA